MKEIRKDAGVRKAVIEILNVDNLTLYVQLFIGGWKIWMFNGQYPNGDIIVSILSVQEVLIKCSRLFWGRSMHLFESLSI